MNFEIILNNSTVVVQVENKKHIKHCYLRVIKNNLIQIRANRYFTLSDAKDLVLRKKDWLENSLKIMERKAINEDEFLYLGETKNLLDFNIKCIDKYYKEKIQNYIPDFVEMYSKKMNLFPTKISYRKNKRTWGSCNYKNELNFNILLMKYPLYIMEYIVVHELAHIEHKNHSRNFWNLVEEFCPNYKKIERDFKALL